jgi:hypothetical protein
MVELAEAQYVHRPNAYRGHSRKELSLTARGIDTIHEAFPQVYEALQQMVAAINQQGAILGTNPAGTVPAPSNVGSLSVVAANGIFSAVITDLNPTRYETYFLEWDTSNQFTNARIITLGPSRQWNGTLGSLTTYWRFAKQLPGSPISSFVTFGSPPTAVVGGGAASPALQPTTGSGTSAVPGGGYGPTGPIQPPTSLI